MEEIRECAETEFTGNDDRYSAISTCNIHAPRGNLINQERNFKQRGRSLKVRRFLYTHIHVRNERYKIFRKYSTIEFNAFALSVKCGIFIYGK